MRRLHAAIERFDTAAPFVIARGAKHHVDVVRVEIRDGAVTGRGEGTPIYYLGDDAARALAAVEAMREDVAAGASRADLLDLMPAGAARNALDAALWDLEAKATGVPVWQRIGLPRPLPMLTAVTVSLGEPWEMAASAGRLSHRELLKLKLGGEEAGALDVERVRAVRAAAPHARLIADANQGWAGCDIERLCASLHGLGVELIEQPLPAGADADLAHVASAVPLAADESCQTRADLDRVVGRYRFVNVKLDKAGGLTEALALIHAATLRGLGIMTGCMLSTSLGVAPAFFAAMHGAYADLDGPLLLREDAVPGLAFSGSDVHPPEPALWG
jgi:L-alanine-DL-glutamate epimerase-like enolase superfamily enzyme